MKKIIIVCISVILLFCGAYVMHYYNLNKEIKEEYEDVVISSDLLIELNSKHKISEYIKINGGKISNDDYIVADVIGNKKIEVLYLNNKNYKRKAYFEVTVVDTTKPVILGSSSLTLKVNSKDELIYSFISADNYTKKPTRVIIGDYDLTKVGKYNLTFKITDESGNYNTKDFTLNVVDKINPSKQVVTKTIYEDVVLEHKKDNTKIGLDVSKWQGEINFDKLKEKNVDFIFIRVGYQAGWNSSYVLDNYFKRNIEEANRVGIPVGVYFYSYATTLKEAKDQAKWVVEKIKPYKIDLPVSFDFEEWPKFSRQNISINDINDIATLFMKTIEDNGYKAMNYSSKYYLESIWDIDEYPVWLAHYTNKTDYKGKYSFWQLCNDGRIDGINGAVDINVMYN